MLYLLLALLLSALLYGPAVWVRMVITRHRRELPGMPGTGGELAEHLLQRFGLEQVKVEPTSDWNDHFDPDSNTVRLSPAHYSGRSLSAVAVATHEVGHALQHHRRETLIGLRARLAPVVQRTELIGMGLLIVAPVIGLLARHPGLLLLLFGLHVICQLVRVAFHLLTLPVEWDASFGKALPILREGRYIAPDEYGKVNHVLLAAALTYVSAALANVVHLWRLLFRR
ncbi:MAG: zinc metallopeptidase [Gammaproteobacteria bacterium]|nr:zinc metallopeptidase [Gammaproteobacteria bacterium]